MEKLLKGLNTDLPYKKAGYKVDKKDKFTLEELSQLTKEIVNETDVDELLRIPTFLSLGLKIHIYEVEELLAIFILNCQDNRSLPYIGWCLRTRPASSNSYILIPGQKRIHILAYTALLFKEVGRPMPLFNAIQCMMRLAGANLFSAAYDGDKGNSIDTFYVNGVQKNIIDRVATLQNPDFLQETTYMDVNNFIVDQGMTVIEDIQNYLDKELNIQTVSIIAIMLDRPELFDAKSYVEKGIVQDLILDDSLKLDFIIRCMAYKIIDTLDYKTFYYLRDEVFGESLPIHLAIESGNYNIFKLFMKKGARISYFSVNRLCVYFDIYSSGENPNLMIAINYFKMILLAAEHGIEFDGHQAEQIQYACFSYTKNRENNQLFDQFLAEYKKPVWKKVCKLFNFEKAEDEKLIVSKKEEKPFVLETERLKSMAFELDLDYNLEPKELCAKIEKMASYDVKKYAESLIQRRMERMGNEYATPEEIVKPGQIPLRRCNNTDKNGVDPLLYTDSRMVSYQDDDRNIWCFTSDLFDVISQNEVNPFTGKKLPQNILRSIRCQKNILEEMEVKKNENIAMSLKKIKDVDVANNDKDELILETFFKTAYLFGMSKTKFKTFKGNQFNFALDQIQMTQDYMPFLRSDTHRLVTMARAIYSKTKRNPEIASNLLTWLAVTYGSS